MLPLYERLRMDKRILACVASMAAGVNFLPWTGPTLRASAALHISTTDLFRPLIPVQIVGLTFVFACRLPASAGARSAGLGQARWTLRAWRAAFDTRGAGASPARQVLGQRLADARALMAVMVRGVVDPAVVFMIGTAVALIINYPHAGLQRARVDAHAKAAVMMAAILLAAGAFTGIMKGSGMLAAMAASAVHAVPLLWRATFRSCSVWSRCRSVCCSIPTRSISGRCRSSPRSAKTLGVPAIQVGQAALLGQMTTGFPVSPLTPATFLVVGLTGIELGEHQRFTAPWLFAGLNRHDDRLRAVRSVRAVKDDPHRMRRGLLRRSDRAGGRARDTRAISTTSSSNASPSGRSRSPSRPGRATRARATTLCSRERMEAVLPACVERGVRIITNMGAANPRGGRGSRQQTSPRGSGCRGLSIATVTGDDVLEMVTAGDFNVAETGEPVATLRDRLVSANAYIGAEPIVDALAAGADVVITGRAADPSLFVAPLAHEFGWAMDDWPRLGRGTLVGHLLECAGQITGGYFADPGLKDVDDLEPAGFSHRRSTRRTARRHHQGAGLRRPRDAGDVQGAAAVRDSRSGGVRDAGHRGGLQPRPRSRSWAPTAWRSTARPAGRGLTR